MELAHIKVVIIEKKALEEGITAGKERKENNTF